MNGRNPLFEYTNHILLQFRSVQLKIELEAKMRKALAEGQKSLASLAIIIKLVRWSLIPVDAAGWG